MMGNNAFQEREFDIRELWHVIYKRKWIILLVGIITAVILFLVSNYVLVWKYESTTQIFIFSKEINSPDVTYEDIQVSSDLIKDYMILATSRLVTEQVITELGLNMKHEDLIKLIHIDNPDETRILNIKVLYSDPVTAKRIADAIREATTKLITKITENEYVSQIVEGNLPDKPTMPNVKRNTALGGAIGIMVSVFICLLKYLADDTIKTPYDIEKYLEMRLLSTIKNKRKRAKKSRRRRNS